MVVTVELLIMTLFIGVCVHPGRLRNVIVYVCTTALLCIPAEYPVIFFFYCCGFILV